MSNSSETELAVRVDQLERRYRHLVAFGVVLLVPFVAAAMGKGPPTTQDEVLEVGELWLVAEDGTRRAGLTMREGQPALVLINDEGGIGLGLTTATEGSSVGLWDAAGQLRISLELSEIGPNLRLFDSQGVVRAGLMTSAEGVPLLGLYGADGVDRASLAVGLDDSSQLFLKDPSGQGTVQLKAMEGFIGLGVGGERGKIGLAITAAGTALSFFQPDGQLRVGLAIEEHGPVLSLHDESGTGRASLGATTLRTPRTDVIESRPVSSLVLFNEAGDVIWKAP